MPVGTGGASAPPTLTVAVLTHNEAHRIEACLKSAAFADQLLVVDSGSTDNTVAIAQSLGAEVHSYPDWQGFAVQRNRLLAHGGLWARAQVFPVAVADRAPVCACAGEGIHRGGARAGPAPCPARWRSGAASPHQGAAAALLPHHGAR